MRKIILSLAVMLFAIQFSFAQAVTYDHAKRRAQSHFDAGNNAYAFGRYVMADSLLKIAIESEKNFIEAHWLLGNMDLENQRKFDEAVKELKIVEQLNPNFSVQLKLKLGYALFNKGDYDEAKKYFQGFRAQHGITPDYEKEADHMIANCDFAKEAVKHPVAFKPINLGSSVNTTEDDLMPALTADEHWMYFTRLERIGRFHDENIFVAENRNGNWQEAQPLVQ
jgi:tetratricopeptide (TPR) repeat protein